MNLLEEAIQQFTHTESVRPEKQFLRVRLTNNQSSVDLNRFLIERGIIVSHLSQRTNSLEQQFLQILATDSNSAINQTATNHA